MANEAIDQDDATSDEIVVIEDDGAGTESAPSAESEPAHDPLTEQDAVEEAEAVPTVAKPTAIPLTARMTPPQSLVRIGPDEAPALDADDPWGVREADKYLRKGLIPSAAKAHGVNVLALAKRNGLYLWIILGECAAICVLVALIGSKILGMPAKAVPSAGQVDVYHKVKEEHSAVMHFAEMVSARMETWNHWSSKETVRRVLPYLDPGIRGVFEAEFQNNVKDAERYEERHLFEPVKTVYKGVKQETKHVVLVFYKTYIARGKDERDFKLDRVARRVKFLEVTEGPISAENEYGLFILRHFDLSEEEYVDQFNENPWDEADGVPADVLQQRAHDREKAKQKKLKDQRDADK
jgi:hypothetical protein